MSTSFVFALLLGVVGASNDFGVKFLEENKDKSGVITLPSGLQYKVLRAGEGANHPLAGTSCECHYEGRTAEEYSKEPKGDKFDSSYDRGDPTSFAPNQVIGGWTEAMQLMVEGDKWEMYIPSALGYGDQGSPPKIGGGAVLVFTMEIIKINGESKPASKCDVATLEGCSDKEKEYVQKKADGSVEKIVAETKRLQGLSGAKMSPDKKGWMTQRILLLNKMKNMKMEL